MSTKTKRITIAEYLRNPTPESYERMVEQMAHSMQATSLDGGIWDELHQMRKVRYFERARSALAAIGITAPKKGRK